MEYKWIRVSEAAHSDVADMVSILNLSRQERNASLGDAVRIAVSEWLSRNKVILKKMEAAQAQGTN